jgi:hypothetical protein
LPTPTNQLNISDMRVTSQMLQSCRITLFTRDGCGLCTAAHATLLKVNTQRPFALNIVDIIKPESKSWRDLYEFDVPVVSFKFLIWDLNTGFLSPYDTYHQLDSHQPG